MTTKIATLAAILALSSSLSVSAAIKNVPVTEAKLAQLTQQDDYQNVSAIKRAFAKKVALNFNVIEPTLKQQLSHYRLVVTPDELGSSHISQQLDLATANHALNFLKGLPLNTGNLLQLRLAHSDMLANWQQGQAPLFAFAPQGNDKYWTHIEAFDQSGQLHSLPVDELPTQPTFIIELDQHKTHHAGLAVMKHVFNAHHEEPTSLTHRTLNNAEPLSTSVLKKIRLKMMKNRGFQALLKCMALLQALIRAEMHLCLM